MSFKDCLDRAVAAGKVSREKADRAKEAFDRDAATFGEDEAARRLQNEAGFVA